MKTSSELKRTIQNPKSGPEVAQSVAQPNPSLPPQRPGHWAKSDQRYWLHRLVQRSYESRQGTLATIRGWHVRIKYRGRREWFNLGTPNRAAAAIKARDIYLSLLSAGWQATLQQFKPDMVTSTEGCAVGEFLDQVKAVSGLKPVTFEIYARKFRSLVADVFRIDGGHAKHDYVNGGYSAWLARLRAVELDRLTPDRVNEWKVRELQAASKNPLRLKRAQVTVRSILLSSKALFAPSIRKHLTVRLPEPLPFEGVELPPVGKSRYRSEINAALLLQQAKRELAEGWQGDGRPLDARTELFKIILLALGAGLRRDEIDTLQWKQIQWHRNAIVIETTEHGATKSADSEGDVDVDPGLLEILKGYMPTPGQGSPFVIQSSVQPRPQATSYHHYRCARLFRDAVAWLRSKGITARNALHSLRKEFGSQICAQAGVFAASLALRHSSINLTREYYLDKKQRAVFEVSKLLNADNAEAAADASLKSP